ncbi:2-oxoglutarate dehydrogenase E1 component [Roseomonas chloroacetimidivorans]|uniref:2-oxoglutarate dehydrogenase E1 component n=1 Tax=Roseomonas chloroacetimidivorans TaxID=1766656 RepID=UPI003C7817BF
MGAASLEALQRQFRLDPASVDPGWRVLFEVLEEVEPVSGLANRPVAGDAVTARLAEAVRARGHLHAWVCPLAQEQSPLVSRLKESEPPAQPLPPEALERLYGGTLTVETAHIDAADARAWLLWQFEAGAGNSGPEEKRAVLGGLIAADEFERFLGVKYPTKKRFGAEGAEAVVPLLRRLLEQAAASGVTHVVIGTMHRGRLNLMANVLGKDLTRMLAEIKGMHPFSPGSDRAGDVPYHLGLETSLEIGGRQLRVTLLANPSHLEAVDPLVLGRARALQELEGEEGRAKVLPIILHTDAAVIGQGVVPETLQLGGTAGFGTGGTVHVVINNRIGFTTEERDARTSTHCTGAWKAIDSGILHVNADDPLAVCRAAELAFGYRKSQGRDAVIDLVCYRRNGHNEIDEPTFTQPLLYQRIAAKEPVASAFAGRLVSEGILTEEEVAAERGRNRDRLQDAYEQASEYRPNVAMEVEEAQSTLAPETGVPPELLRSIAARLAEVPTGMALHPRMGRVLKQRMVAEGGQVSWPVAEALAFGSLLTEGVPIRLSGQDVVRGAFSHRHFGLVDTGTGAMHVGLNGLAEGQARFSVYNSPLSEYAVLGFEYGYSLARPDVLTLWEAQFGDFANGAQIVIDQFVMSAEEKWGDRSGLVMLLPHGLEGQGPEHSSARPERYLQMAAKDNVRIVIPSTPANYFHLLREQALGSIRRPLIVMSPKKLLRLPAAVSPLDDFAPGRCFRPVIAGAPRGDVGLVLFCSGKIAYELEEELAQRQADGAVVVRLEQLYPFPAEILAELARRWPDARCRWVQEEPENMGAWSWVRPRLEAVLASAGLGSPQLAYVGRPESPSPAGSFHGDHDADQRAIVERACAAAAPARATRAA